MLKLRMALAVLLQRKDHLLGYKDFRYNKTIVRQSYFHYGDVIMGAIASQITSLPLLTQPFIQTQIKENIKAPRHWHLCVGNSPVPVNSRHKWPVMQKMWWRHHVYNGNCHTDKTASLYWISPQGTDNLKGLTTTTVKCSSHLCWRHWAFYDDCRVTAFGCKNVWKCIVFKYCGRKMIFPKMFAQPFQTATIPRP